MKKVLILITFVTLMGSHYSIFAQYEGSIELELQEEEQEITLLPPSYIEPMPYLSSCKSVADKFWDKKSASDKKMIDYIYTTLVYPEAALTNGVEGMVILSFTIKKDGWVDTKNIRILRDIGYGCGEEAHRIVQSFNKELGQWSFSNEPRAVRYNLPIRFRLH